MFYSAVSPTSLFTSAANAIGNLASDVCQLAKSTAAHIALRAKSYSWMDGPSAILFDAIRANDVASVKLAIMAGADPNTAKDIMFSSEHLSPLHIAVSKKRNPVIVDVLLKAGADPNVLSAFMTPPLHEASRRGTIQVVRKLLEAGADPKIRDHNGNNALFRAMFRGSIRIFDELLKAGIDPNVQNNRGQTLLHSSYPIYPFAKNLVGSCQFLLSKGAEAHTFDKHHETPLHLACQNNHLPLVKALINFKLGQAVPTQSALISREMGNHSSTIRSQNFYRFLNAQNKEGKTALHLAVESKDTTIIEYLLENGAQIPPDADGETPLDLAFADSNILDLFKKHTGWANEAAANHAFEKRNFPALLFILEQRPLLSSELRQKILADAQRPGMESIRRLLEGGF